MQDVARYLLQSHVMRLGDGKLYVIPQKPGDEWITVEEWNKRYNEAGGQPPQTPKELPGNQVEPIVSQASVTARSVLPEPASAAVLPSVPAPNQSTDLSQELFSSKSLTYLMVGGLVVISVVAVIALAMSTLSKEPKAKTNPRGSRDRKLKAKPKKRLGRSRRRRSKKNRS